jgi:hypothetical protein
VSEIANLGCRVLDVFHPLREDYRERLAAP